VDWLGIRGEWDNELGSINLVGPRFVCGLGVDIYFGLAGDFKRILLNRGGGRAGPYRDLTGLANAHLRRRMASH